MVWWWGVMEGAGAVDEWDGLLEVETETGWQKKRSRAQRGGGRAVVLRVPRSLSGVACRQISTQKGFNSVIAARRTTELNLTSPEATALPHLRMKDHWEMISAGKLMHIIIII